MPGRICSYRQSMSVLFVHGAGGYDDDQPLVDTLRRGLADEVSMPRFSDDDLSFAAWSADVVAQLAPEVATVVGHSFGGSILLKMAALSALRGERPPVGHSELPASVRRLVILAAPDWSPAGWDVPDYRLPANASIPAELAVALHHCTDDEVVPIDHLDLLSGALPTACTTRHERGGHQFTVSAIDAVLATVRPT